MPDNVKSALLELRRTERMLSKSLARAARTGDFRQYKLVSKRIALAERQMRKVEREIGLAS